MGFKWLKTLTDAFSPVANDAPVAPAPVPVTPVAAAPPSPPMPPKEETFEEAREAFFNALRGDDDKTIERVAAKYPDEALNWRTKEGTPLQVAQNYGSLKAFKALVTLGANPEENYGSGKLPLHVALEDGRDDFVAFLLDKNVNIEAPFSSREYSGFSLSVDHIHTPLGLAIEHGRKDAFVMLIERGADTTRPHQSKYDESPSFHPDTAVDYATEKEHFLIADLAKRAGKIRAEYLERLAAPPPEPVIEAEQAVTLMPQLRLTGTGQKP